MKSKPTPKSGVRRQQSAFAEFGELALRANDLTEILTEACRLVGQALGTDLAKVMELLDDGITVIMRAGVGWDPGLIGKVTVKAEAGSSEGYALQTGEPVISSDIKKETRFKYAKFIEDAGVKAIANVIIFGHEMKSPFGILQIDSRTPRRFSQSDVVFLRGYANLLGAAVDRIKMTNAAATATERLSVILESTGDSVILVDSDWSVTYINQPAIALLTVDGLKVGASFWDFYPHGTDTEVERLYRAALSEQRSSTFEDYFAERDLWLEVRAYPTSGGLSIFFRDISVRHATDHALKVAQARTAYLANHDNLTGLPNRATFHQRLEQVLAAVIPQSGIAIHYLDLDGFKTVNDVSGHDAGDALLMQVAQRLHTCIRAGDMAARIGGDEFAIIQVNIDAPEGAAVLAQRLLDEVAAPYLIENQPVLISTSIGIATAFTIGMSVEELVKQADLAMYNSKVLGGSLFSFFGQAMEADRAERQRLKKDLRLAIADGQFELHYQPIIDLASGRIVCLEALIRWNHPDRGLIAPNDFIPIGEESGLILPIGDWVLSEACREAAKWDKDISVAVNLSPTQMRNPNIVGNIVGVLQAAGLSPNRLEIEITELVLLKENDFNMSLLRELKKIGVRISMDDFGTGYSSLTYLRSFPFDKIKVDRSFVKDVPENSNAAAIVHAVALLGRSFNVATTAEGVETSSQLDYLRSEGYDQAQGYLFSKPVPRHKLQSVIEYLAA